MATQASLDQIQNLYIAFYGRPADAAGQEYWADELEAAGGDLSAIINAFASSEEYQRNYGDLEAAELVNALYQQILGRDAEEAGLDFYVGELADGNITEGEIALAILNGAQGDDAAVLENRKAVADSFTATVAAEGKAYGEEQEAAAKALLEGVGASTNPADVDIAGTVADFPDADGGTGEPTEGEMFTLTDGRDAFTGTEGDDTFMGLVGQNQNGASANAFSTGDYINGGEGTDKVMASMVNDNQVANGENLNPAPRTENVEEVYIEALQDVTIDAGRMNSVEQYWTDNSAGDLIIEDVRLGDKLSATKDITFGLVDVDTDAGLYASFDTNSLVNQGTSSVNSQLLVRIADVTTATPEAPLSNVEVTVGFTFNGEEVVLEDIRSTDGTYTGMRAAIDAALDAQGLTGLVVTLDNPYNQVTIANNTVDLPFTAQEILVTDPSGKAFTDVTFEYNSIESVNDEFLVAGTAAPIEPGSVSSLIETNVILDNAGRGSTAGEVVIGGMSNSDQAIQKLNLEVDRSSKVSNVFSVQDTEAQGWNAERVAFEQIEVTSGEAQGDLSIGNVGNVYNFDATAFEGENLSVSGDAGITKGAVAGTDWSPNAEDEAHVYNTADSNDTVQVDYSGDKASEFAGFSLSINTGAGNDTVNTESFYISGNNLENQEDLDNVVINTGTGNDTIWTKGAGSVLISAGAGDDTVYTENSGEKATWVFNAEAGSTNINDLDGKPLSSALMYKGQLTVTFSAAGITAANDAAGGGVMGSATTAVAGDDGYESTVTIELDGMNAYGTQADINAAITKAISEDPVLSKLLKVEEGADNTLLVQTLIDGTFDSEDLNIDIALPTYGQLSTAERDNLLSQIRAANNDSTITTADVWGAASPADGATIDAAYASAFNDAYYTGAVTEVLGQANSGETLEVQTLDLSATTVAAGESLTFTIDGETIVYLNGTAGPLNGAALVTDIINNIGGTQTVGAAGEYVFTGSLSTLTVTQAAGNGSDIVDITTANTTPANGEPVGVETTTGAAAGLVDQTGSASTLVSDNQINLGSGDDVLVLGTAVGADAAASSNDTIVFDGAIGNNTIVNFNDDGNGLDQLDFTAYLDNIRTVTGSTSTESESAIDVVYGADADLSANEVLAITFDEDAANSETLADLTAQNLLDALNGVAGAEFGGAADIDGASATARNTLTELNADLGAGFDFDGDTMTNIILVEASNNDGYYKVFEVSSTVYADAAAAGANDSLFTEATLLGSVDFGDSVTFATALLV